MPIHDYPLKSQGIRYSQQFLWRLSAQFGGMTYERFMRLDGDLQSAYVAFYEDAHQMRGVSEDINVREHNARMNHHGSN